mgnify:CR=1 FL=1
MALSLAVLLVPIALMMIFARVVLDGDKPHSYDAEPTLEAARASGMFEVTVPEGLGEDWTLQSATFKREAGGGTLRLGYADPDDQPVLLVESSVATATLIPAELGASPEPLRTFQDEQRAWSVYDGRPGETALALVEKGRTILIVGPRESDKLEEFAASLP